MKLSVIILNYNVRYFLELCLRSVQQATQALDAEIIIVDNGSTDGSCKMVQQTFPDVTLIQNHENLGFSKGNNIGVQHAKGNYICILNPDTVVPEDAFANLIDFAKSKDKLGIVGCQLINGRGEFLPESKRHIPTPFVALKKMLGDASSYYVNRLDKDAIGKVDVLVGAFMFMKKSVYHSVGGFDEDYFMYGEDIDLSLRIKNSGLQNYYYGAVKCVHYKGESTFRDVNYAKRFYGAMQIFYKKHFKRNIFFNGIVWLGIKLAYLSRKKPVKPEYLVEHYLMLSHRTHNKLNQKLGGAIQFKSQIDTVAHNTCIIFDQENYSFKFIIESIASLSGDGNCFYRILPKHANFIIGSDSTVDRGEIVVF